MPIAAIKEVKIFYEDRLFCFNRLLQGEINARYRYKQVRY